MFCLTLKNKQGPPCGNFTPLVPQGGIVLLQSSAGCDMVSLLLGNSVT